MLDINETGIITNGYVLIPIALLIAWVLAYFTDKYNWKIKEWF